MSLRKVFAIFFLVYASAGGNAVAGGSDADDFYRTKGMPAPVRKFLIRRADCNHWMGEEPYDEERKAYIENAWLKLRCDDLGKDEGELVRRYQKNRKVIRRLNDPRDLSPD